MFSRGKEGPMEIVDNYSDEQSKKKSTFSSFFNLLDEQNDSVDNEKQYFKDIFQPQLKNPTKKNVTKDGSSEKQITGSIFDLSNVRITQTPKKTNPLEKDRNDLTNNSPHKITPSNNTISLIESSHIESISNNSDPYSLQPVPLVNTQQLSPTSIKPPSRRIGGIKKSNSKKRFILEDEHSYTEPPSSSLISSTSSKPSNNHFYYLYLYMGYLQLAFNAFLISIVVYLVVQFFLTVKRDVDIKVENQMTEILNEIAHCSKQYIENRCHPETRVPAMEKACMAWEVCMNRDPAVVGRAKVSAITFAEILNSFVEPISIKTMMFFVVMIGAVFVIGNVVLGVARSKELKYASQQNQMMSHCMTQQGAAHPMHFYNAFSAK